MNSPEMLKYRSDSGLCSASPTVHSIKIKSEKFHMAAATVASILQQRYYLAWSLQEKSLCCELSGSKELRR